MTSMTGFTCRIHAFTGVGQRPCPLLAAPSAMAPFCGCSWLCYCAAFHTSSQPAQRS